MSRLIYDFLSESILFWPRHIDELYSGIDEDRITKELSDYREHVLKNSDQLHAEAVTRREEKALLTETFSSYRPEISLIKQSAFYMDRILIDDPLFRLTDSNNKVANAFGTYLGFEQKSVDREHLASTVSYMKELTPAVASRFIYFLPLSYSRQPQESIPLYASETNFSDSLDPNLMKWFHQHAEVHALHKSETGWRYGVDEEIKPSRAISIRFAEHAFGDKIYFLFDTKITSYDKDSGIGKVTQWLPESPPSQEHFNIWVNQAINRTAIQQFDEVLKQVEFCNYFNSYYLTTSPFISKLLNLDLVPQEKNLQSDLVNLAMNLTLPVTGDVALDRLMEVRENEGEAFQNFRFELEKQLRGLRSIKDVATLRREMENVEHDLMAVQVNEVNKKIQRIKRSALGDAAVMTASLMTTVQTGGVSLIGAAVALAKGYKNLMEYISILKENPAYFLWKLSK